MKRNIERLLAHGILFILLLIPAIALFLSSHIAYGYNTEQLEFALLDYILPNPQAAEIIHEVREGEIAYIAYRDYSDMAEDEYFVAAVDLKDPTDNGILWFLGIPDAIEYLAKEGSLLYITTCANGMWSVDLDATGGPKLQGPVPSQQDMGKMRLRSIDPLNPYNTTFSTYNLSQYSTSSYLGNWNYYPSTSPWSIGSGFGFPQNYQFNYQLPISQTNLWNQPLGRYSLTGISQSYLPQLTMPYMSSIGFPSQYPIGGYPMGGLSYSPLGFGMTSSIWPLGYTGTFSQWPIYPTYPTRPSTSGTKAPRYRSPVHIRLALDNPSTGQVTGQINLELYDLNKKKISSQTESLTIEPGQKDYTLTLKKVPENTDTKNFANYNLKYGFLGGGVTLGGQKSLFDVADKLEVRVVGPDSFHVDQQTPVRVHAFVHGRPVPIGDATVTVDLLQGGKTKQLGRYKTNSEGFLEAPLNFSNNSAGTGKLRIKVSSTLGSETIEEDIEILRLHKILLTTDKPIYQPGQTIHIRTLTLRRPDLLPEANKEIIIECDDPKGNKVFRVNPETDQFGVASADFTLGTDINLGLYTVRAICIENDNPVESVKKVNVERYVLPKFKVDLETDAEFYSPGDTVLGTTHAKYFFGEDLSGATVTIEASKFDVEFVPFQTITGETDEEGFFSFDLTLPDYFVGLPLELGGAFVKLDIKVTDTAGHQEAIVRELTITGSPIIVRMIPESGSVVPGVENIIYILTTDPKGRGLKTTNLISFDGQALSVPTDDQGAGSFTIIPDEGSTLIFQVASQANGQSALVDIDLSDAFDEARILLRTDNAIYKVGDTMIMDLYTPELMARRVFVDVIRDRQTILTKGVDIIDGHGRLFLDITNEMVGTILLEAYYISEAMETASDIFRDKKIVYVNPADDIQVSATLDKEEYLPGEKARIEFQVTPPQPAALGITIVDEAVYALQENRPGLLKVYFSMEEEIMKPRFWPLIVPFEEAVTSEAPEEEVQEMAEIVFASAEELDIPALDGSSYPDLIQKMKEAVQGRIAKDAKDVVEHLRDLSIYSESSFEDALNKGKIKQFHDPWDNPYKLEVGSNQFILVSSGPDGKSGNIDDISYTQRYYKPYYGGWYGTWGGGLYGGYGGAFYTFGGGTSGGGSTTQDSGFLTPPVPEDTGTTGKKDETQEPRKIRRDFPETLLWEPLLITDPNGMAFMDANMADSITTWRMSTLASTLDGKLGGSTDGIVVFQDFFIDLDLPVTLTQKDEISLPVAIYNYLDQPQTVTIVVEKDPNDQWFVLMGPSQQVVNLEPKEVTSVNFRIKGMDVGWHELTVFGYGTQMSDAIARRMEVLPDGKEFHVNVSDRLADETSHVLHIPRNAIDGASRIMVKVYPGIFSQLVEGLDKLFRVPNG